MIAPLLLSGTIITLTIMNAGFLRSSGWSPVHRTKVEWPSLLTLGPHGWVLVVAFVVCGLLGMGLAAAMYVIVPTQLARIGAGCLGMMALALCLVAFRPDKPEDRSSPSWHDQLHNDVYWLIPAFSVAAGVLLCIGLWKSRGWHLGALASLGLLVVIVPALALTFVEAIAQAARYFLFGPLLLWVEVMALLTVRDVTRR